MSVLFRKARELEAEIDRYLDAVLRGAGVFREGIRLYVDGRIEEFEELREKLDRFESEADGLRRSIEDQLYKRLLIPEHRGDVLGLLESSDRVLNQLAETMAGLAVERPEIPAAVRDLFVDLGVSAVGAVESMALAIRGYLKDPGAMRGAVCDVSVREKETDRTGERIRRSLFADTGLDLCRKLHARAFVHHVERIADAAEDVCDRLAVAAIKRDV
ncbi:MAG: DUF47 family protein [Candidatus Eisenbacteria bacterium]|nr:DUF47 family protein [Candidatus Eisenbacteria bacterium]